MRKVKPGRDDCFTINDSEITIPVLNVYVLNQGSGVCSRKNKTHFPNVAVVDYVILLLQLIGKDRHRIDIAMLHHRLSVKSLLSVIEEPLSINSAIAVLKSHMTQDILHTVMLVLPNKRNLHLLCLVLECAFTDGQAISASKPLLSSPATKVRCHFEGSPLLCLDLQVFHRRLLLLKGRPYLRACWGSRVYRKRRPA